MATLLGHSPYHRRGLTPAPRGSRPSYEYGDLALLRTEPDSRRRESTRLRWRMIFARMLFAALFLGVLALLSYEGTVLYHAGKLWPPHWLH
jgi:hypothetical protein